MSEFKHKGEDIQIDEAPRFKEGEYTVESGDGKIVYKAGTRFGNAYSTKPDRALEDAKDLIDRSKP